MAIGFWVGAAILVSIALALLIPALSGWRRTRGGSSQALNVQAYELRLQELERDHTAKLIDDEALTQARAELQRALLQDAGSPGDAATLASPTWQRAANVIVAVTVIPAATITTYLSFGNQAALDPQAYEEPAAPTDRASVEAMVNGLAARLEAEPNDGEGWWMLGRSYVVMERYPEAVTALTRARDVIGDQPNILVDLAEALGFANGNNLRGQPFELLTKAIDLEPNHPRGLWLTGLASLQVGKRDEALAHWRALLIQQPAGSQEAETLTAMIERVVAASAQVAPPSPLPPTADTQLVVHVSLDSALTSDLTGEETVFIYARAPSGPAMPLAIVRHRVADLPLTVTLDDSKSMTPQMRLSGFPEVVVLARVSRSGDAQAQAGDLQAVSRPITVRESDAVALKIDQIVK